MCEMYEFKEQKVTLNHKFNQWRHNAKYKVQSGLNWVVNNPEKATAVLAIGGTVFGAGVKGFKSVSKMVDEHNAAREMYCGTVNRKVRLVRALTDKDLKMLGDLMQNGMTRYEALDTLGLIK